MKRHLAVALVALLLVSLWSFASVRAEDFPRNETIYTANSAPPASANPFQGGNIIGIDGLVFEPLFMLNFMTTELKPWLAEYGKWIDSTTYEVKLREGTRWQDGKPLTAEDVKFSFEYYEKLGLKKFEGLSEIKVVDDRTVRFVFSGQPNVWVWDQNLYSVLIIPKHIFENLDPEKVKTMTFTGDDKKYLVGSGAYKLKEVVEQQKSILERNEDWWGAKYFNKPAAKYIIQLYVSSNDQAANMFLKGDLDVATYYLDIAELKKQNPNIVSWLDKEPYFPPVVPVVLYFNTQREPMNMPAFRKAIAMAINPEQIVQQGPISAVPDQTPLGPIMQGWKDKIGAKDIINEYGWKYGDLQDAMKILDQLGIKDTDGDGIREYNGKPVELHFVTCSGCSDWIQAGEIIANQLKPLGIKVVIDKGDWTNFFMQKLNSGDFDLALHWAGTFKPDPYSVYYNLMYYKNETDKGGANFGNYHNERVNELLQKLAATPNQDEQIKYLKELTQIWLQDVPAVPVYTGTVFYEANTQYWKNWPNEKNPYGVPIFWPGFGTWGTALAMLGVQPAQAPTTTTSSPSGTTTTTGGGGSTCGPAALILLAAVPLLLRRRR
ncbi:ABC transporter substrate-binding protein [Thermococcus radiotolerans]|uniref:DNA-binding protein n=1 Tax=Thermococcus radiotolerans TaxID=187880 RepID=A0A2Z2NBR5_9EURY|nr:ABC transporter substrate-binding protein [Thermococcus radiotolerans]ASJ15239.1 DNA-binding protein [Thermococcus radiotolerans]